MGPVLVDTNLLLLLVVGRTDRSYIATHKRLSGFDESDYALLLSLIGFYDDIVVLPHILAEVSNLIAFIRQPARGLIQTRFARFVENTAEIRVSSASAVRQVAYARLGLTDAVILQACALDELGLTLLTADGPLVIQAEMAGYRVENFEHWRR